MIPVKSTTRREVNEYPARPQNGGSPLGWRDSQSRRRLRASTEKREQVGVDLVRVGRRHAMRKARIRSEEHTSELQSHLNLVCRLLLEKKKKTTATPALAED